MASELIEKAVGYLVLALIAAAVLWKANSVIEDHYQAPIKKDLKAAEEARDQWAANAQLEKTEREKVSAALVATAKSDRVTNQKLDRALNELEKLKQQIEDVRVWADTPIPIDVIRLRLDAPTATPADAQGVQGGSRADTTSASPRAPGGGSEESGDVESHDGAGGCAGEVQPATGSD